MLNNGVDINSIKIRRFVNYEKLGLYASYLAHCYDRYGLSKIESLKVPKFGIKRKYYLGYIEYIRNIELNLVSSCDKFKYKYYILDKYLYDEYFNDKNKSVINEIWDSKIPEMFNYGFIFTNIQTSVQLFTKGDDTYKKGF